jgi:hypothetical protein
MHISLPAAPGLPVRPALHPEPPRLTTKTIHPRSTPSSSVIPPTLQCPPAGETRQPRSPFVVVRLPGFGDQVGLIPDTPRWPPPLRLARRLQPGKLSRAWQRSPQCRGASAAVAQIELRKRTGGFNLLSAKEVQPGVLVFRLRDQTPSAPSRCVRTSTPPPSRLQPPRRSPTPAGRHHGVCPTFGSLTAMSSAIVCKPDPRCTRAHTRQRVSLNSSIELR